MKLLLPAKTQKNILSATCFLQVLLFAYTGCSKLLDHHNFSAQLSAVLPQPIPVTAISYCVPVMELAIAAGICFRPSRLLSMYAFLLLLILFTVYIIVLLIGIQGLPCSCGGVISSMTWKQHLVFNCFLIVLSMIAIKFYYNLRLKSLP